MTRHPWTKGFAGYFASLSTSNWLFYILTSCILSLTLIFGLFTFQSKLPSSDWIQFPFIVIGTFVHSDEYFHHKSCDKFQWGRSLIFLTSALTLSFLLFYTQDLISNMVNPLLEHIPDNFDDIQTRSQHVLIHEYIPHVRILTDYNNLVLGTFDINWALTDANPNNNSVEINMALVAANPNYFVMLSKDAFFEYYLPLYKKGQDWFWRLSEEAETSMQFMLILRKYESWTEKFNMQLIKIKEGDLLWPSKAQRTPLNSNSQIIPHQIKLRSRQ